MDESRISNITITNITYEPENNKVFGFAVCDEDASSVYIPGRVVEKYELSPDDVGETFEAILLVNKRDHSAKYYAVKFTKEPDVLASLFNDLRPKIIDYVQSNDVSQEEGFQAFLKETPA